MTASSDKVQYLLQNSLEQSIGLVRKGIFSQQQLQTIMLRRQKCQHAMLKKQYKITDYLGSIQYQYELERQRKKRMAQIAKLQQGSNPLFRKQSSADYAIVKRILRLWDRTMHKYKFKIHLWKQYLSFTIAINSKKHFYKVLTNSLKFLPFETDLWKIGAVYQMEHGMNMWKGRRILIKGLKMTPEGQKNISLAQFMIDYQLHFLKMLIERKNILIKGQEPLKMIGQDGKQMVDQQDEEQAPPVQTMNLEQFDDLIWLIIEQAINKNVNQESKQLSFQNVKSRFLNFIKKKKQEQTNHNVIAILVKLGSKLNSFQPQNLPQEKFIKQEKPFKIQGEDQVAVDLKNNQDVNIWKERIIQKGNIIQWKVVDQALKTFCLKPHHTADILNFLLRAGTKDTIEYLISKKGKQRLPSSVLSTLLDIYMNQDTQQLTDLLKTQIDRFVSPSDLNSEHDLFEKISKFNAKQDRLTSTTKLLRSLSIAYGQQQELLTRWNEISQQIQ